MSRVRVRWLIERYIAKEILSVFAAFVFILLFIAISNKFVMLLAKAASGKLYVSLIFKVVALYIPELFAILAPVAMFIAILFTFSRLHADSEITVLLTSGFDWINLTRITLLVAGVVAVCVAVINLNVVPAISVMRAKLLAEGQAIGAMNAITPGRFQTIENNDQLVFYVEDILPDGKLHNIFIAQQPAGDSTDANTSMVVVTAKSALLKQQNNHNEFYLILHDGYRYDGVPGTANYKTTSFVEYGRQLKYDAATISDNDYMRSSKELFKSKNSADIAELQWRLAMPIAVLLLAMIAIPLSKVQPRQGRYAKFLPAVLIYMIYYNLLTIIKRSVANGKIPELPGIWALHIVFLLCAILLLLHASGRLAQLKYRLLNR